jgi:hypothetical protein
MTTDSECPPGLASIRPAVRATETTFARRPMINQALSHSLGKVMAKYNFIKIQPVEPALKSFSGFEAALFYL